MANLHVKRFQANCFFHVVRKGLINQPDGSWKPATTDSMDMDMLAGRKLNVSRPKREKAARARGGAR